MNPGCTRIGPKCRRSQYCPREGSRRPERPVFLLAWPIPSQNHGPLEGPGHCDHGKNYIHMVSQLRDNEGRYSDTSPPRHRRSGRYGDWRCLPPTTPGAAPCAAKDWHCTHSHSTLPPGYISKTLKFRDKNPSSNIQTEARAWGRDDFQLALLRRWVYVFSPVHLLAVMTDICSCVLKRNCKVTFAKRANRCCRHSYASTLNIGCRLDVPLSTVSGKGLGKQCTTSIDLITKGGLVFSVYYLLAFACSASTPRPPYTSPHEDELLVASMRLACR